jgi:hypothetical protein
MGGLLVRSETRLSSYSKVVDHEIIASHFLCLEFQAIENTRALAVQLSITKNELVTDNELHSMDRRLIPDKYKQYLIDDE